MLNEAVAPMLINNLLESMKVHLFSLSIDDSNDTDFNKMNPIIVRIFDFDCNMIVTCFLDMCTTTTGTAKGIYSGINTKLEELLGS